MITEDYVSFETAKLLKEKGFDSEEVGCRDGFYSETAYESGHGIMTERGKEVGLVYDDLLNSELSHGEYLRPTLQMATKWLREVHGIHINVFRYPAAFLGDNNEQHKPWWFQYTFLKPINEIDIDSRMTNDELKSAEEAMDYAIKYCLENLI